MRFFLFGISFISSSVFSAEVTLKLRYDLPVRQEEFAGLQVPKQFLSRDGTLTVQDVRSHTPGRIIAEEGAQVIQKGHDLMLCIPLHQNNFSDFESGVGAISPPFKLEFHIKGLKRGEYTVRSISLCPEPKPIMKSLVDGQSAIHANDFKKAIKDCTFGLWVLGNSYTDEIDRWHADDLKWQSLLTVEDRGYLDKAAKGYCSLLESNYTTYMNKLGFNSSLHTDPQAGQ